MKRWSCDCGATDSMSMSDCGAAWCQKCGRCYFWDPEAQYWIKRWGRFNADTGKFEADVEPDDDMCGCADCVAYLGEVVE